MTLDKIMAIKGKPGLYKLLTNTRSGFVGESLIDGKRVAVGIQKNVSILSEIAIYTLEEEVPLRKVLKKMQEKENGGKTSIGHKAEKIQVEEYFFEVLPDYDEDRVYPSDIRKIIQWYNILLDNGVNDFSEPDDKGDTTDGPEEKEEEEEKEEKEEEKEGGKEEKEDGTPDEGHH